jgi:pSer/pThr/pTyr-binding forkhead associated (FHA) protein
MISDERGCPYEEEATTETGERQTNPEDKRGADDVVPQNAFLIIEGIKVFPLQQAIVSIGRRLDNTLVIDDPRVSRTHALLRAINGRYVIFDLDSTGGTYVNGQRISQSALFAGDVIWLAGVTLVFGQDNPPPRPDLQETNPPDEFDASRLDAHLRTLPPILRPKDKNE